MFCGWLGQTIKNVTGFGEYHVKSNALYEGSQVPFVRNEPLVNGTTISHREYLMDVTTSSTAGEFKIQSFDINPALGTTFEWLAQIAANYEEYVMEGLLFVFRSMSADALNSTNTALGNLIMATQYNSYLPDFVNKAEMESHNYSMSGKPCEDMIHPIECDPHQNASLVMFCRNGAVPEGADRRLYDLGRFFIATTGFQAANVNIGELHLTYQVTLMKPRLWTALGRAMPYTHVWNTTGYSGSAPFGTLPPNRAATSTINPPMVYRVDGSSTYLTITLPTTSSPLFYSIDIFHNAIPNGAHAYLTGTLSNTTDVTGNYMPTANSHTPAAGVITGMHSKRFMVSTRGDYFVPVFEWGWLTATAASTGECHMFIQQVPNN